MKTTYAHVSEHEYVLKILHMNPIIYNFNVAPKGPGQCGWNFGFLLGKSTRNHYQKFMQFTFFEFWQLKMAVTQKGTGEIGWNFGFLLGQA